nr:hypothetical protein [uncultured Rhodopila sp.]
MIHLTDECFEHDFQLVDDVSDLLLRVIAEDAMDEYARSTRRDMQVYMKRVIQQGGANAVLCAIDETGTAVGVLVVERLGKSAVKVGMLACSKDARPNTAVMLMAEAVKLCRVNEVKYCYTTFTPANPPHRLHGRMGFRAVVGTYRTSMQDAEDGLKKWVGGR